MLFRTQRILHGAGVRHTEQKGVGLVQVQCLAKTGLIHRIAG